MTTPEPRGRRLGPTLLGVAVSVGLLWWVLRDVDLGAVGRNLAGAHLLPMLLAVAVATATFPIRALRWQLLLDTPAGTPLPWRASWHGVAIGFMGNNLLPLRAGELLRALTATRLAGPAFATSLASVAVERVFDGLCVVGMLAGALLVSDLPPDAEVLGAPIRPLATSVGLLALVALVAGLAVARLPDLFERVVRAVVPVPRVAEVLVGLARAVHAGLSSLRSPARLANATLQTVVLWLVNAGAMWLAFLAFDLPLGPGTALVLQGLLIFGVSVPSSPGFWGPFEAVVVATLGLYGVDKDTAFSYALAYHATTFVPITILGLVSLGRTSLGLGALRAPPTTA